MDGYKVDVDQLTSVTIEDRYITLNPNLFDYLLAQNKDQCGVISKNNVYVVKC